jgi:hypothetical protein
MQVCPSVFSVMLGMSLYLDGCIRLRLASRRDSRPDEAFDSIVKMLASATPAQSSTPAPTPSSGRTPRSEASSPRSPRGQNINTSEDGISNFDAEYYRRTHAENVAKFKRRQVPLFMVDCATVN